MNKKKDIASLQPQLFNELGLNEALVKRLADLGFVKPTPIQEEGIPVVLRGQDMIACAQTGSGKTASFLLPLLHILEESSVKARMPRAIIMEPTRELALQVFDQFTRFSSGTLKAALLVGGESMQQQTKIIQANPDVLIVTPGRLLDLCERQIIMLFGIRYVVIDEADRMLDMGFLPDVTRIMEKIPVSRQTMLFSATFDEAIQKLSHLFMLAPKTLMISKQGSTVSTISQYYVKTDEADKKLRAVRLLEAYGFQSQESCEGEGTVPARVPGTSKIPSIIFCNRKANVTLLVSYLKRKGFAVESLHGDLQQSTRNQTVEQFKAGQIHVLVASDIAARGLDVEDLGLVINYDVPLNAEDYVHRIGRTGRAGKAGLAFTLVERRDAKKWAAIEELTQLSIEEHVMTKVVFQNDQKELSDEANHSSTKALPSKRRAGKVVAQPVLLTSGADLSTAEDGSSLDLTNHSEGQDVSVEEGGLHEMSDVSEKKSSRRRRKRRRGSASTQEDSLTGVQPAVEAIGSVDEDELAPAGIQKSHARRREHVVAPRERSGTHRNGSETRVTSGRRSFRQKQDDDDWQRVNGFGTEVPHFFMQTAYQTYLPTEDITATEDDGIVDVWSEKGVLPVRKNLRSDKREVQRARAEQADAVIPSVSEEAPSGDDQEEVVDKSPRTRRPRRRKSSKRRLDANDTLQTDESGQSPEGAHSTEEGVHGSVEGLQSIDNVSGIVKVPTESIDEPAEPAFSGMVSEGSTGSDASIKVDTGMNTGADTGVDTGADNVLGETVRSVNRRRKPPIRRAKKQAIETEPQGDTQIQNVGSVVDGADGVQSVATKQRLHDTPTPAVHNDENFMAAFHKAENSERNEKTAKENVALQSEALVSESYSSVEMTSEKLEDVSPTANSKIKPKGHKPRVYKAKVKVMNAEKSMDEIA